MNVIFAGTPDFAVPTLKALIETHQVCAVLTQPDRKAGRGRKINPSAIKIYALEHNLKILQPENLISIKQQLINLKPDLIIVVAYGVILSTQILAIPKFGCLNIHASLLPKWRGAAPIQRAILSGDKATGICIMQMAQGLDTGDILHCVTVQIAQDENSQQLHNRLAQIGADTLIKVLANLKNFNLTPQRNNNVSYAHKITKQEAIINWQKTTLEIYQKIKAFNPYPIAQSKLKNNVVRIWQAQPETAKHNLAVGTIAEITPKHLKIATNDGFIKITQLQFAGKNKITAQDFYNSNHGLIINHDKLQ